MKEKKCKHCKDKFAPIHFNQKFCFKDECKNVWIETEKEKQWRKRKKKMQENLQTVQELMKATQKIFNAYIRERDKGKPCISCGRTELKKVNAGHYFSSGGHKNVTFNEDNVHLQCEYCNQYLSGNLLNYQIGIEKRIGGERLLTLHEEAHKPRKYTREELKELMKEYKEKLKILKSKK